MQSCENVFPAIRRFHGALFHGAFQWYEISNWNPQWPIVLDFTSVSLQIRRTPNVSKQFFHRLLNISVICLKFFTSILETIAKYKFLTYQSNGSHIHTSREERLISACKNSKTECNRKFTWEKLLKVETFKFGSISVHASK